jgi:hypothetical protein
LESAAGNRSAQLAETKTETCTPSRKGASLADAGGKLRTGDEGPDCARRAAKMDSWGAKENGGRAITEADLGGSEDRGAKRKTGNGQRA